MILKRTKLQTLLFELIKEKHAENEKVEPVYLQETRL